MLIGGNAGPRIQNLDFDRVAAPAAAKQDAARFRVAEGVRQQVVQDPPEHHRVTVDQQVAADDPPFEATLVCFRGEFVAKIAKEVAQRHRLVRNRGDACVEL
ncbi:hypothetical protein D9M69_707490 [compost metagenome]